MSAEHALKLFTSFWFYSAIFSDKLASPPPPPARASSSSATRSSHEGHDGDDEDDHLLLEMKLFQALILHVRSRSDHLSGGLGLSSNPFPLNSVLLAATPKLRTILFDKEVLDFEGERPTTKSEGETEGSPSQNRGNKKSKNMRRKKKRKERSKSLSALKFEELKGFMDPGFVFFEQDRDLRQGSVGLQG